MREPRGTLIRQAACGVGAQQVPRGEVPVPVVEAVEHLQHKEAERRDVGLELPWGQVAAIGVGVAEQPQACVESAIIRPGVDDGLANQRPPGMSQDCPIRGEVKFPSEDRDRVRGHMCGPAEGPGYCRLSSQPMGECCCCYGGFSGGRTSVERSFHDLPPGWRPVNGPLE